MEHNNQYYRSGDAFTSNEPASQKRERGGGVFATVVIVIVLILLALLVVGLFWPELLGGEAISYQGRPSISDKPVMPPEENGVDQPEDADADATTPPPTPQVEPADRDMPTLDGVLPILPEGSAENPIPNIFEAVSPGVVSVINYANMSDSGKQKLALYGSGSGFFVSSNGYIVTNAHVVEEAAKITVKLIDGNEVDAKLIGADLETDVAVLKVDRTGMPALALGDSDAIRVGEYVLAIGNPIDADKFQNTLTYGIISAASREITIDTYTNHYLQTDAAINVGNSGGPLLNMKGEVIGINSAKTITAGFDAYGSPVSAEGIGFALPINQVERVMEQLITKGQIDRPGIGLVVTSVTEAAAEANGVPMGALVDSVVRGGPASQAGVKAEDIITEANGAPIKKQSELIDQIRELSIGDELNIKVYRNGKYLDLTIVVANKTEMDFEDKDD